MRVYVYCGWQRRLSLWEAIIYMTPPSGAGEYLPKQTACGFFLCRSSESESYFDRKDQGRLPSSWPSGNMFENLKRCKERGQLTCDHIPFTWLFLYSDHESSIKACSVSIVGRWAIEEKIVCANPNEWSASWLSKNPTPPWRYRCKFQRHYASRERLAPECWKTFRNLVINSIHVKNVCHIPGSHRGNAIWKQYR
jgi:hypothetical protein